MIAMKTAKKATLKEEVMNIIFYYSLWECLC